MFFPQMVSLGSQTSEILTSIWRRFLLIIKLIEIKGHSQYFEHLNIFDTFLKTFLFSIVMNLYLRNVL